MSAPSPLGTLGKFPPEIRLCIWDYLVPLNEVRPPLGSEWRRKRPRHLRIMRTSRALHDEISRYLYSNFKLTVRIRGRRPGGSALRFELETLHARWMNADTEYYIQERFVNFPFHKVHITIHLSAPDPSDRGQLVLIFERLDKFIGFLGDRRPAKGISLVFGQTRKSISWVKNQQRSHTVRGPNARRLYAHEAMALRLFRLQYYQGTAKPREEDPEEALDWASYDYTISNILQKNGTRDGGTNPCGLNSSHYLEEIICRIEKKFESWLTCPKPGLTAEKMQSRRRSSQRLQEHEEARREGLWEVLKEDRKEHERIRKKVEIWLTYFLPDEDEPPCGCHESGHDMKMVDPTWNVPNNYESPSWCQYDSESEEERERNALWHRWDEAKRHYTCG